MGTTDSTNKVDQDGPATTGASGEEMLVDVGGRRLYITCMGEGSPAVILEHGMATESGSWAQVQQAVARFTRVCAFDRAGRGKSDPAPTPRTSEDMVADLYALLANASVPRPYILVGNSLGGFNARLYAHKYPDEVVGLVLVDSMHPDQFARIENALPPETPQDPEDFKAFRQSFTRDYKDPTKNPEGFDQLTSHEQARAVTSLGDLPMIVLAASEFRMRIPEPRFGMYMQNMWHELQRDLARLSSNSKFVVVENSGHFIQLDQPQVVVDAIRDLVEQVR
ncbi:MAG: alpha/beta hydrolase [Chloroflexota bacterium]|nr:alpha/beta hydrolase [Chloroflexota bacterium]MDQ5867008.1 alpha/beta hydrolase [Chloroflexota bacterium]